MNTKAWSGTLFILYAASADTAELVVGKVCPVTYKTQAVGSLIFSKEWYHSSRSNARYIPGDNATGVGLEIHLINNRRGHLSADNIAQCDRYRMLQIRKTNSRLLSGEKPIQIDVPDESTSPFYDSDPLEHGYGTHATPSDDEDKPWKGRPVRASTVAIYDTPYVSDAYGVEGKNIEVTFETCIVCEREDAYDKLLSCGTWGYEREYMGGMTGWAEPEFIAVQCHDKPSDTFRRTLDGSNRIEYSYWLSWR